MGIREAAFHHAGHAVAAHLSKYHVLAAALKVDSYGTGEIVAALSRRKLQTAGKAAAVSARTDPDVAAGIAVILAAGLAGEEIAAARALCIGVDRSMSEGDFEVARTELRIAGLADDTHPYQEAALRLLNDHWSRVERLAEALVLNGELGPQAVHDIIQAA
jgi:hypothetical protein